MPKYSMSAGRFELCIDNILCNHLCAQSRLNWVDENTWWRGVWVEQGPWRRWNRHCVILTSISLKLIYVIAVSYYNVCTYNYLFINFSHKMINIDCRHELSTEIKYKWRRIISEFISCLDTCELAVILYYIPVSSYISEFNYFIDCN